jgi:hypothetical protein
VLQEPRHALLRQSGYAVLSVDEKWGMNIKGAGSNGGDQDLPARPVPNGATTAIYGFVSE